MMMMIMLGERGNAPHAANGHRHLRRGRRRQWQQRLSFILLLLLLLLLGPPSRCNKPLLLLCVSGGGVSHVSQDLDVQDRSVKREDGVYFFLADAVGKLTNEEDGAAFILGPGLRGWWQGWGW